MSWCSRPSAWLLAATLTAHGSPLIAQGWRESQLWAVAATSDPLVVAGGVGVAFRDARRTRIAFALATGAAETGEAAGRAEITWHFLLDPSRTGGVALYGGGGLALTARERDRLRPWLQLLVGLEWSPAGARGLFLEAGAGGGARLAAGVRMRKRNAPARQGRGAP